MTDKVIELLHEAYNAELETVTNYLANSVMLTGVDGSYVAEALTGEVQEELGHAEQLAERLHTLGDNPNGSQDIVFEQEGLGTVPTDGKSVEEVIDGVIEAEKDAIQTYRELINEARDADDVVTEDLAVQLLADEERHLKEFEDLREEL